MPNAAREYRQLWTPHGLVRAHAVPLGEWRSIWRDPAVRGVYVFAEVSARGARVHKVGSGVLHHRVAAQTLRGCNRVVAMAMPGMAPAHRATYELFEWWMRQTLHVAGLRGLVDVASRMAECMTAPAEPAAVEQLRPTFDDMVAAVADGLLINRDRLLDCRVHPPLWYPPCIRTKAQRKTFDSLRLMHRAGRLVPGDIFIRRFTGLPTLRLQVGDSLVFSDGASAPDLPRQLLERHLSQLVGKATKRDAWRELRLGGHGGCS